MTSRVFSFSLVPVVDPNAAVGVVSRRGLPGPQPGHHDRRSSPADGLWQHDGELVLPVDLL